MCVWRKGKKRRRKQTKKAFPTRHKKEKWGEKLKSTKPFPWPQNHKPKPFDVTCASRSNEERVMSDVRRNCFPSVRDCWVWHSLLILILPHGDTTVVVSNSINKTNPCLPTRKVAARGVKRRPTLTLVIHNHLSQFLFLSVLSLFLFSADKSSLKNQQLKWETRPSVSLSPPDIAGSGNGDRPKPAAFTGQMPLTRGHIPTMARR